jgi:hypothetical protein
MTRRLRIVLRGVCLLAAFAAPGCRAGAPLPLPDAARAGGLNLGATPASLVIRPSGSGRIRFFLYDEQNLPVPDYPIQFSIVGDASSDGTANAQLSSTEVLTDSAGSAVLEIIVGNLGSNNRPAAFTIQATCQGSPGMQADILVTTNAFSVEILPVPADDLLGSNTTTTIHLLFYDETLCAGLDLGNLGASPNQPRALRVVAPNTPTAFAGVAGQGNSAVVGLGLDSRGTVLIGGCVDLPGSSLRDSQTIRATLYLDHLFPSLAGTFQVSSDFTLSPAPPALASMRAVWQEWTRCPLDPARLWLDCTIDALVSNPTTDPNDCVPVPGGEGSLGDLLMARRGTAVAALAGTLTGASATPCRAATDSSGATSLDALVSDLFGANQARLASANLGSFPTELATLLGEIRIDSTLTLAQGRETNSYDTSHALVSLVFPSAISLTSFDVATLGLPLSEATGIVSTFKNGQISIPVHAFTAWLGTTARYAFESNNLKSRGTANSTSLVNWVFGLGQQVSQGTLLGSCDALDVLLSDQIKQPRGSLLSACRTGLIALAGKLNAAFDSLNGPDLDFRLSGSAPVIDTDGDGRADALGQSGGTATSSAVGPGLWSAEIDSQAGSYLTYGSWTAVRVSGSP